MAESDLKRKSNHSVHSYINNLLLRIKIRFYVVSSKICQYESKSLT